MSVDLGQSQIKDVIQLFDMKYLGDLKDKKECTACKSESYRLIHDQAKERTYFAISGGELVSDKGETFAMRQLPPAMAKMYICAKCGHVDFYSYFIQSGDIAQ